eukprot:61163-Rhodomonas_salina.6
MTTLTFMAQRNTLVRGLTSSHPNDLVVIADVDEIPAGYILDLIRSCDGPSSPTWLYSRFFNFKFEVRARPGLPPSPQSKRRRRELLLAVCVVACLGVSIGVPRAGIGCAAPRDHTQATAFRVHPGLKTQSSCNQLHNHETSQA